MSSARITISCIHVHLSYISDTPNPTSWVSAYGNVNVSVSAATSRIRSVIQSRVGEWNESPLWSSTWWAGEGEDMVTQAAKLALARGQMPVEFWSGQ